MKPSKYHSAKVLNVEKVGEDFFILTYESFFNEKDIVPGQFVSIDAGKDFFLKRPFSIFDANEKKISVFIKVVGRGTKSISNIGEGEEIKVHEVLGKGFSLCEKENAALIGGGIGIAPLYFLAKRLMKKNTKVSLFYGGRNKKDILLKGKFENLGCDVFVSTDDGSMEYKGTALDRFKLEFEKNRYERIYACGPKEMLKGVSEFSLDNKIECELSVEEVMGCGFGVCMGCAVLTVNGYKMVCKDGPVFKSTELVF